MLSEYEKTQKKGNFIRRKIDELVNFEKNKNLKAQERLLAVAELYSKLGSLNIGVEGFKVRCNNGDNEIRNAKNNGCTFYYRSSGRWISKYMVIKLYDTECNYEFENEDEAVIILPLLERFVDLEKEYLQFSEDLDKAEKITDISEKSTATWLTELFKNSGYSYYTSKAENKITVSIQLKNGTQLDIPVYFKSFQKIVPEIMTTIQKYEQMAEQSKIKVLISNVKRKQEWITNKKDENGSKN